MLHLKSGFTAINKTNNPFDIDFVDWVEKLKGDPLHQEKLVKLSKMDKAARDKQKISQFPAIAPSVYLVGGGSEANIQYYTNEIFLDSDGYKSIEEVLEARSRAEALLKDHYTYSDLSLSSLGWHLIVRVDPIKNKSEFFQKWDYLERQMAAIGLTLDKKTRNVVVKMVTACHAKYNTVNPDATPMVIPVKAESTIQVKKERILGGSPDRHVILIDEILSDVEDKGVNFTSGQMHNYTLKVAARTNRSGIPLTTVEDVLERKLMLSKYPEHLATLRDFYARYSDQFGQKIKRRSTKDTEEDVAGTVELAINYLEATYQFRYNTVLGKPEYKREEKNEWLQISDYRHNSLWKEIQTAGINISKSNLYTLLNSDHAVEYDPFRTIIDALPEWDGKNRITELANTINAIYPEKEIVAVYLMKWIVALIACMYDMIPNHQVLTFMGGQGIGKTKWLLKFILPGLTDYFYSGPLNPQDKDSRIRVAETFLILLDELEVLGKYNLGVLKELITIDFINERRPYGARTERLRRRASFAATVNLPEFLKDQSGSRRFMVIETNSLDYTHNIDMKMVFAQAVHLYKSGFRYWFDKAEGEALSEANTRFQVSEPAEELIPKCFRLPVEGEKPERFTVTQIAETLKMRGFIREVDSKLVQVIGSTMGKLGFKKNLSKGKGYYWLIEISNDQEGEVVTTITHVPDGPDNDPYDIFA